MLKMSYARPQTDNGRFLDNGNCSKFSFSAGWSCEARESSTPSSTPRALPNDLSDATTPRKRKQNTAWKYESKASLQRAKWEKDTLHFAASNRYGSVVGTVTNDRAENEWPLELTTGLLCPAVENVYFAKTRYQIHGIPKGTAITS